MENGTCGADTLRFSSVICHFFSLSLSLSLWQINVPIAICFLFTIHSLFFFYFFLDWHESTTPATKDTKIKIKTFKEDSDKNKCKAIEHQWFRQTYVFLLVDVRHNSLESAVPMLGRFDIGVKSG